MDIDISPAMVAKKVPRSQWQSTEAKAALNKEWNKLLSHKWPDGKGVGTWDASKVEEASVVRARARHQGIKYHFGRIAELLYLKGGELPEGHPDRKLKAGCFLVWSRERRILQLCHL